jgi:uracil-DNA glycosylase
MLQSEALQIIANKVATCTRCTDLATLRVKHGSKTVPGEGNPNADLMIIGEAPGESESRSGRPFCGRAGQLLGNIIHACGWKREDIFISNVLKCRPPGNRDPLPEEATNCRTYLDFQIRTINPKYIICLGRIASIHLLEKPPERTMGSLRGIHEYKNWKVICTYHPSFALRNPAAKQDIWEDLAPIREELNESH